MADWKTKIELRDLHEAFEKGEMTVKEVGKALADRVQKNRYAGELEDIIYELRVVDDVDDYDWCLEQLYDFGDYDHRIWINTF